MPRVRTAVAMAFGLMLIASPVLGQAPGSGDPSFPKDMPPASPGKPRPDPKPEMPRRDISPPTGDPRGNAGLIDLRPRFRQGQETRYTLKMSSQNQVSSPAMPGQGATDQDMKQEIGFVLRVKDTTPSEGATVELVYESVKVSIKIGDTDISYDSTVPPRPGDDTDILAPAFKALVGSRLTIKFDATGNIKSVEGGSELGLPGMMGQAGIDPKSVGSLFGPIRTEASGKGLYRIGEKWSNVDTIDMGLFGRFRMVTDHTLQMARGGTADVHFSGRMEPGSESGTPGAPFQLQNSRTQGKYVWDTELGQLRSMESEQDVNIASGPTGNGAGMKARTTVRVDRVERFGPGTPGMPSLPQPPTTSPPGTPNTPRVPGRP
ncbi:MAG: DUF6263 family protein [Phycisphaerales bacterium]